MGRNPQDEERLVRRAGEAAPIHWRGRHRTGCQQALADLTAPPGHQAQPWTADLDHVTCEACLWAPYRIRRTSCWRCDLPGCDDLDPSGDPVHLACEDAGVFHANPQDEERLARRAGAGARKPFVTVRLTPDGSLPNEKHVDVHADAVRLERGVDVGLRMWVSLGGRTVLAGTVDDDGPVLNGKRWLHALVLGSQQAPGGPMLPEDAPPGHAAKLVVVPSLTDEQASMLVGRYAEQVLFAVGINDSEHVYFHAGLDPAHGFRTGWLDYQGDWIDVLPAEMARLPAARNPQDEERLVQRSSPPPARARVTWVSRACKERLERSGWHVVESELPAASSAASWRPEPYPLPGRCECGCGRQASNLWPVALPGFLTRPSRNPQDEERLARRGGQAKKPPVSWVHVRCKNRLLGQGWQLAESELQFNGTQGRCDCGCGRWSVSLWPVEHPVWADPPPPAPNPQDEERLAHRATKDSVWRERWGSGRRAPRDERRARLSNEDIGLWWYDPPGQPSRGFGSYLILGHDTWSRPVLALHHGGGQLPVDRNPLWDAFVRRHHHGDKWARTDGRYWSDHANEKFEDDLLLLLDCQWAHGGW